MKTLGGMSAMRTRYFCLSFDATIFKKATELLRRRRGQEKEEKVLEAQVKIQ